MTVPATRPVRTGIGWGDRVLPVAVALALVAVLSATAPDLTVPPRQWVPLAVGEPGTLRDFTLQVTEVRQASAVDVRGEPLTTTAVFVVVGVEADVLRAPVSFTSVALQTRSGDRYDPRAEWVTARLPLTQPGFTVRGTWVFEVPVARLAGAHIQQIGAAARVRAADVGCLPRAVPRHVPIQWQCGRLRRSVPLVHT